MALKKTFTFNNGFSADYIRISNIWYINGQTECTVGLQIWKDQETRADMDSGKKPAEETNITVTLGSGENIIERCYNGLKNLPDFSDSEDV